MKTTTVPAQITTVEDRFAGGLSLSQLLLLVTPIFISCGIYLLFPPFLKITLIKVMISLVVFIGLGVLAIRIRGKLVVIWLSLVMRYASRPRYYVFNKNSIANRKIDGLEQEESATEVKTEEILARPLLSLATVDLVKLENIIGDPRSNFKFQTNKNGALSVHITEIQ